MKSITKKLSALLVIMLAFAGMTFAQVNVKHNTYSEGQNNGNSEVSTAQTSANAHIKVYKDLQVTNLKGTGNGLDFGDVPGGVTATITAASDSAASFEFTGVPGQNLAVTFASTSLSMTGPSGSNPLTLNLNSPVFNTSNTQSAAQATNSPSLGGTNGNLYMWVGGSVVVPNGQKAGDYNATITVNAAYTGY